MQLLSLNVCSKSKLLTVHSFLNINDDLKKALNNIGLFEGKKIIIKDVKYNKKMLFIIINGVEYAIRAREANQILVYETNK